MTLRDLEEAPTYERGMRKLLMSAIRILELEGVPLHAVCVFPGFTVSPWERRIEKDGAN